MSVDLPATENHSARAIAVWFSEIQLGRAITYLELVRTKAIPNPGPEIEKLLGPDTSFTWTMEEIDAVQRKLALAICIQKRRPYFLTKEIRDNVLKHRTEVLKSYNELEYYGQRK
jgi:hypothetical protein